MDIWCPGQSKGWWEQEWRDMQNVLNQVLQLQHGQGRACPQQAFPLGCSLPLLLVQLLLPRMLFPLIRNTCTLEDAAPTFRVLGAGT